MRVALLLLVQHACASNNVTIDVDVELADGTIRGVQTTGFQSFRGIPFAAPPLDGLRFSPPQPNKPWRPAVLDATQYKHNCLQAPNFSPAQPRDTVSEDCLYLNVFTPANMTGRASLPLTSRFSKSSNC